VKSSTLSPGKTPPYVVKLREEALRELDGKGANEQEVVRPEFEMSHEKTPDNDRDAEEFDRENWVAQYPGQNSAHIGNGSGGVRK